MGATNSDTAVQGGLPPGIPEDTALQPGYPPGATGVFREGHPPAPSGHPPAIWFFFWGEFAERSSYYGMRTILFLYMTMALRMADTDAGPLYSAFKMACYFLPLLGGFIADRWLGRYWTIVGFSIPYVAGHFILGIPHNVALLIALALLAGGSGVIKPNISTLLGQTYDQKRPGQERLRAAAFNWFYLSINVGALISTVSLPEVRDHYIRTNLPPDIRALVHTASQTENLTPAEVAGTVGMLGSPLCPSLFAANTLATVEGADFVPVDIRQSAYAVAFAFPAWLMVLSLLVFAIGKRFYAVEKLEHHELTADERRLQWATLGRLLGIFALIVLYWVGYEHNDTLWVAFTRDYVDLRVPFKEQPLAPDQLQFLNPLFVILMIPLFNVLFGWLDPEVKVFTAMRKILAGFLLTAAAIGIMALAGFMVQGHNGTVKVSVFWPAIAIVVLTVGEVLLYGTMLELAYAAAPKSMKGFVTACFLVTSALGNFVNMGWTRMYGGSLTDELAKRGPLPPGYFFGITALAVVAAAVAFVVVGRKFERTQADAAIASD